VPVVRAAAAADDGEPRQRGLQHTIVARQLVDIADVDFGRGIELRMAALRGIRADAANAVPPGAAFVEHGAEVRRVRAIDQVVRRVRIRRGVGATDRVGERFA